MKESPYIKGLYEVDLGLTLLFRQIYGEDEYHKFKETASLSDYKKQFSKLINTIKKSFDDTCRDTDSFHLKEINDLIGNQLISINDKKTVEELYQSLVVFFAKLCFLLIGKIPQNGTKKKCDNRSAWKLNEFRQIEYTQNKDQKLDLLIELLKNKAIEGLSSYKEELDKYRSTRLEKESFFKWFNRIYPEVYFDLFERTG